MTISIRLLLAGSILAALCAVAIAQQTQRIRGTIETVDGNTLTLKSGDGATLKLTLVPPARIVAVVKASMADIEEGTFLGSAAMPQPDGSQKAISVWIFPDWIKPPQLHVPYDMQPGSTMTNAIVDTTVGGVDGQVLTVKYPNGEKKIVVGPNTPLLTYERGDKADIKVGAKVFVRAAKQADGSLTAAGVTTTRDGSMPPM